MVVKNPEANERQCVQHRLFSSIRSHWNPVCCIQSSTADYTTMRSLHDSSLPDLPPDPFQCISRVLSNIHPDSQPDTHRNL